VASSSVPAGVTNPGLARMTTDTLTSAVTATLTRRGYGLCAQATASAPRQPAHTQDTP
jgi:hypothetical protein